MNLLLKFIIAAIGEVAKDKEITSYKVSHKRNAKGELVAEVKDDKPAGTQVTRLPIRNFAAGVYLYRVGLEYGDGTSTRLGVQKFVVVR